MAEAKPDVTGKGPTLMRETLTIFKEIDGLCAGLPGPAADKIKSALVTKAGEIEPLLQRGYMKTVKGGEISWSCKELALELKASVEKKDAAAAEAIFVKLDAEVEELIHKVKTFVIRMT